MNSKGPIPILLEITIDKARRSYDDEKAFLNSNELSAIPTEQELLIGRWMFKVKDVLE